MKGTNEINPEFNGNGKAVPLLEKPIDDTIAKTLPVIPAPETEISAPADVKTGTETQLQSPLNKPLAVSGYIQPTPQAHCP